MNNAKHSPPKRNNSSPNLAAAVSQADLPKPTRAPSPSPAGATSTDSAQKSDPSNKTPPKKAGSSWSLTGWIAEKVIQSQNPDAKVNFIDNCNLYQG